MKLATGTAGKGWIKIIVLTNYYTTIKASVGVVAWLFSIYLLCIMVKQVLRLRSLVDSVLSLSLSFLTFNIMLSLTSLKGRVLHYNWRSSFEKYSLALFIVIKERLYCGFQAEGRLSLQRNASVVLLTLKVEDWKLLGYREPAITVCVTVGYLNVFNADVNPWPFPQEFQWQNINCWSQEADGLSPSCSSPGETCPAERVWWKASSDSLLFFDS